jgi:CO/xanthine dehydrogenase Mo-binding subunit
MSTTAVGRAVARSDAEAKVRGTAQYGVDVVLPGMVYSRLLRSPVPAGCIVKLDVSRAEAAAGVLAVVTAKDVPNQPTGMAVLDQPLFADDRVRYQGEPVAAVVAESLSAADAALRLIELVVEEEPPVADIEQALQPESPLVHPDWRSYGVALGSDWPRDGNVVAEMSSDQDGVEEAFAEADEIVEETYRSDRQYQAYLEPKMAVAEYDSGRYTVHVSHQFPFSVRDRVAQILQVPQSAVRVVGHHIGGGFGAKLDVALEPYAAWLARKVGRPVKMVNTRSEDLLTAPSRENAIVRIRSGVTRDGRIVAREMDVLFDSGAYAIDAPFLASIPLFIAGAVYRVGKARVRCRAVYTNTAPTGAFRGVSGAYLVYAVERHMDHIAAKLGMDRRELRLRNLMQDGDSLLNGQRLDDAGILREAFAAVEERAPWAELGKGKNRGVGIAAAVWLTNPLPGSATLKLNEDGRLGLITGATDNGSGAVTMGLRQIAAAEVGIDPDQVIISMPDTDTSGFDSGSQGSRTTHVVGRAVQIAGEQVRKRILETAAELLEADTGDLEVVDGEVGVVGVPTSRISVAAVASHATATRGPIMGVGSYTTPLPDYNKSCASGFLFPTFPTPTYHVHVAEVEVDPVTGRVHVLRYLVAQEVGRAINPLGVVGQIQGGVTQGLGYALWEKLELEHARYRQRSLESYGLPLAVDVPQVEVLLLEHADQAGPFGAKGVAEPPLVPVAAAIANAVADATGGDIRQIPISPQDVLRALGGM